MKAAVALASLLGFAAAVSAAEPPAGRVRPGARMDYLDNGAVRVGVDLARGGAIAWLAESDSTRNLINVHDNGRYVQQSYYAGPRSFGEPHPAWKNWCWNPIGAGDCYGHNAQTLEHRNDGKTLYVKTRPMQWALDGAPGDCRFETWIELDGNVARVRCRLTNRRDDTRQYPARDQELPALYAVSELDRLYTYTGPRPFTGGELTRITRVGIPWARWRATEHWAALVGPDGQGVGLFNPRAIRYTGGFSGKPGAGGPLDPQTGYFAPLRREILDHDITYQYQYALIVGSVEQIRAYAHAHRPDAAPRFRFARDRQGWTYAAARDAGWPIEGRLVVTPKAKSFRLESPVLLYRAEKFPVLEIRAALPRGARARLRWATTEAPDFPASHVQPLSGKADGSPQTYRLDLSRHPHYRGAITGLWLELSVEDLADRVEIDYLGPPR